MNKMYVRRDRCQKRFVVTRGGNGDCSYITDRKTNQFIAWFMSRARCERYCASIQQRLHS